MELDQLYFERDLCLSSLQRMVDCSNDEEEFRVRVKELNSIKKQFSSVQLKIEKFLVKNGEFKKDEQLAIREKFDDSYYKIQVVSDRIKSIQRKQSIAHDYHSAQATTPTGHTRIQLPALSLPIFQGQLTEWNAFYDLFNSLVHNNENLSDVERFRYLLLSLRGEPYNLIKSIPITEANYINALQVLLNRYENKRIIATKHLDKIIDVQPMNENNPQNSLRNILNVYHENLTALKSLELPVTHWSFMLLNILLRKITSDVRRRFELSLTSSSAIPNVSELLDFLEKELTASEVMSTSMVSRVPATARPATTRPAPPAAASSRTGLARSASDAQGATPPARLARAMSHHAATLFTSNASRIKCNFCKDNSHPMYRCEHFNKLTSTERLRFINENKLCLNCLFSGHKESDCKSKHNCHVCSQRHHTSIHNIIGTTQSTIALTSQHIFSPKFSSSVAEPSSPDNLVADTSSPKSSSGLVADISSPKLIRTPCTSSLVAESSSTPTLQRSVQGHNNNCTVLLTTALVNLRPMDSSPSVPRLVRALVDQGSQATLITEACVQRLRLPRYHSSTSTTVSGIGDKNEQPRGFVICEVTPHDRSEPKLYIEALILPNITSYVPSIPSSFEHISHLKNLPLADPELRSARPVELLLGSDYTDQILLHNNIKGPPGTPVAINSIFGYLLNGTIAHSIPVRLHTNLSTCQLDIQLQRFWALESIPEVKSLTKDEQLCEKIFVETHSRDETGKYTVSLPFKEDAPPLGESREIALSRFNKLEQRFERQPTLRVEYAQCLQEYLAMGHMERVTDPADCDITPYYIPHHCVVKKNATTTKCRVVFDASCKTTSGRSLNDNLLIGQKLHQDVPEVLLRFRLNKIVFTADIKMMYRYINLRLQDRDFQRILWRNSISDPIEEYRLCTVTFGVASSPFLALRTLRQLALDEAKSFPRASQVLLTSVFVDDVVSGADTLPEALALQRELTAICKAGTFELRKWTSNNSEFLSHIKHDNSHQDDAHILSALDSDSSVKVLGLKWNPTTDSFSYQVESPTQNCTKRIMLSEISKIYDPLGFLSPIILFAKHLIQLLWVAGTGWDESPPTGIRDLWVDFISELHHLQNISIPRHVLPAHADIQIHGFSDASEKAYAACVYLRVIDANGDIQTHLLLSKTKLAPLKRVSLPRLELCGAELLSKLISKILTTLGDILSIEDVYAWSDSSITLAWLRSPPHEWRTFVSNRVTETTARVPAAHWRHVRSEDNPADIASRGVLPSQLDHQQWFHGPAWLSLSQADWPVSNIDITTDEERRKHVLTSQTEKSDFISDFIERYSSLPKLVRIFSLVMRFINKCRKASTSHKLNTVHENKLSLNKLIFLVQQQEFAEDISRLKNDDNCSNRLQKLKPFIDDAGLLRVGGRIQRSHLSYDAKHPILLPKRHALTTLLIDFYHLIYLHVGPQTLQYIISQSYWILSARSVIRKRTRRCVRCFRLRPVAPQPVMAPLPAARVRALRPFLHVAVDFAGHFNLKSGSHRNAKIIKAYVCVFVCMSTKALHLELVPNLSTESFLNALRRFISRRGLCTDIYSDCGRNFIGCDRYLQELFNFLNNENIQNNLNQEVNQLSITWHFNPPYGSHFGGIFEAAVKSMKTHLYRVVGNLTLNYDEFNTILCQIEAILNSRPLTIQSNDPSDPLPLTPGHFLIGEPLTSLPEFDYNSENPSRLVRWQVIQQATQHFWKRWSVEYLHQLSQRSKWFRDTSYTPLKEGTVVVLVDNNLPPLQWRLARVHKLHPGADGVTRVVTVRIGNNFTKRPVVKVCPLPIE
ncbi:hypothetical protein ABMA28_004450 [Loxostege sticticalis]|uniref:Integrase catalytic domain-containing protein n=1 Tax=Loxostege sticticalis TaxID=481309 RepID=A0ABD0SR83_LOXSC